MLTYIAPFIGSMLFANFISDTNNSTVNIFTYNFRAPNASIPGTYNKESYNSVRLNSVSQMRNALCEIDVEWSILMEDRQVQPLNLTLGFDNYTYDWSYEFLMLLPHSYNVQGHGLFPFYGKLSKTFKMKSPEVISYWPSRLDNSNVVITITQISPQVDLQLSRWRPRP